MAAPRRAPAVRVADPAGTYRRRIRLVATAPGEVQGGLEDDFHHFGVTLHHDGARVTGVEPRAARWPWTSCPAAGAVLTELVGLALTDRQAVIAAHSDPHRHCTHQFDLAALAVVHAHRVTHGGEVTRQYDVELPAPVAGVATPRLGRDGEPHLEWVLAPRGGRRVLVAPDRFLVAPWRGGFLRWADATLDPDDAEAAIVLRRACDIGLGRGMDLEAFDRADELAELMTGVCFTFQPGIMGTSTRQRGTIRDFSHAPDALLADDPTSDEDR